MRIVLKTERRGEWDGDYQIKKIILLLGAYNLLVVGIKEKKMWSSVPIDSTYVGSVFMDGKYSHAENCVCPELGIFSSCYSLNNIV
jgi:hypothetical protein